MKLCVLLLTCADRKEADGITKSLFEKKLIVCAKYAPVSSLFLWKRKLNSAREILIIIDSIEENFEKIETEIRKLHSYETFTLISLPVNQTTKDVKNWVKKEIK